MRGETGREGHNNKGFVISIHSPHARGDALWYAVRRGAALFQSTPLMRGETNLAITTRDPFNDFNPLPSCEGRRLFDYMRDIYYLFQSTPLMRGETM